MKIDAVGIVERARKDIPATLEGVNQDAGHLRAKIGLVAAILRAGAFSKESPQTFRDGCGALYAKAIAMKEGWELAFGVDWNTGEPLPLRRLRQETVEMRLIQRSYVSLDQLRKFRPWADAENVANKIARAAQDELNRPARERAAAEREKREAEARKAEQAKEMDAARVLRDLEAFRQGRQPRVPFPDERQKQAVRSRWG